MRTETATFVRVDRTGSVRWVICGLLFFATTVNYIDRQVLSILKPTLQTQFGWREADYAWMVVAFQLAYALMLPIVGRLVDHLGTRFGYAIAVVVWSAASMSHAFARTAFQFTAARFALGIGEAANFPAAIRAVADWFPQKERSFATGIFNSGTNVGVVAAAWLVPFVTLRLGWQAAFLATGILGLVWLVPWLLWFRPPGEHGWVSKKELLHIQATAVRCRSRIDMRSRLDITGRVAVVIGATSGLGRTLAIGLAEHGATVVPAGRRQDRLAEVCRELEAAGSRTLCRKADIQDRGSIDALRDAVLNEFGRVDAVVNAAGATLKQPTATMSEEDWSGLLNTNLTGVLCSDAASFLTGECIAVDGGYLASGVNT